MADFVKVVLDDGTEVVFQSAESDLVRPHGGPPVVERYEAAMDALGAMAHATHRVARSFAEKMKPDELALEIGVGLSGEVGWFFAKSEVEATLTMTLTWKSDIPVAPAARRGISFHLMPVEGERVVAATASVWVDGRRAGSAVVVDDRHLLTAWHVVEPRPAGIGQPADRSGGECRARR